MAVIIAAQAARLTILVRCAYISTLTSLAPFSLQGKVFHNKTDKSVRIAKGTNPAITIILQNSKNTVKAVLLSV